MEDKGKGEVEGVVEGVVKAEGGIEVEVEVGRVRKGAVKR